MGNPFTPTTVSSYNANPPPDDGSQVAGNIVAWSTIKSKLPDPIKSAFDTSETNTNLAFSKIIGGGGFTTTAISYQILAADQGKFIKATASGVTITTPDATVVGSPFVCIVINESTADITLAGANPGVQQTVDGANTITMPAGSGLHLNTDGTNWFTAGQNFTKTQVIPQGRLTLVSGTPIMVADETAKTAIFYTPFTGDLAPIPINGSTFTLKEFTELTLTLNGTNYVAANIYDVFLSVDPADGTTVIIGSGPAWQTSTAGAGARGTGVGTTELVRLKGLWVNKNAITLRNNATTYSIIAKGAIYIGSFFVDSVNGQVNCHVSYGQSRFWDIWNAYNRSQIVLQVGDSTASWTYSNAAIRPSNNAVANSLTIFAGLPEETFELSFLQRLLSGGTGTSQLLSIGVGYNSTSAYSGKEGLVANSIGGAVAATVDADGHAYYSAPPTIGINTITALESGSATGTTTFHGTNTFMIFLAKWRG